MENQNEHRKVCKELGIECLSGSPGCPLDDRKRFPKGLHHHGNGHYLIEFKGEFEVTPGCLDEDQCERFILAHLQRLKDELRAREIEVDFSEKATRLCWSAHMVCDHASDYYWKVGAGPIVNEAKRRWEAREKCGFTWLSAHDPDYLPFLQRIARRVLAKDPLANDVCLEENGTGPIKER